MNLCEYCNYKKKPIADEYDAYEAQITQITPMPAMNLTTGEQDVEAEPPYHSLFIYEYGGRYEVASFPIRYCPVCGKRLKEE